MEQDTVVLGWTKVSHLAPSKFTVVPEPPLIFGHFLQSSAGTTPIYEHLINWRQCKKWCSVENWEPFQGVLATKLTKIGWFRHYYFFYHWEPLCRFWPFLAHENRCGPEQKLPPPSLNRVKVRTFYSVFRVSISLFHPHFRHLKILLGCAMDEENKIKHLKPELEKIKKAVWVL